MSQEKEFFVLRCGDNLMIVRLVRILCIRQNHHAVVEIAWLRKIILQSLLFNVEKSFHFLRVFGFIAEGVMSPLRIYFLSFREPLLRSSLCPFRGVIYWFQQKN